MAKKTKEKSFSGMLIIIVALLLVTSIINVYALSSLSGSIGGSRSFKSGGLATSKDLSTIDLSSIKSTGQSVALLFPVDKIKTQQDAIDILIPTGTPEYGEALGISFDDPLGALSKLQRAYPQLKTELQSDSVLWQRYLNLAGRPVGISCEFCCGVGPLGITQDGDLRCGCSHNPAIQALTMGLMKNTDYTDAEILREAMRWKIIWFPKDMIKLGMQASGGEINLNDLPSMVGGC